MSKLYPALHRFVKLLVPLLPLSFTPNLITVILSTINSLSLNYTVSSRSRTLLLVLSLKLLSPVISLPYYTLSSLAQNHWTHWIQALLFYGSNKILTITQPPYLHNLISVQRPCSTRSSSVVTLAQPPSSSSFTTWITSRTCSVERVRP